MIMDTTGNAPVTSAGIPIQQNIPAPITGNTQTPSGATVNATTGALVNTPPPPAMGSVAGTVQTPQAGQTQSAPTVSYMANATAAGLPGAPQVQGSQPTSQSIGQNYQSFANQMQGQQAPATYPGTQIQSGTQPATGNPVFDGLTSSMAPILNSLNQVISDINNPAITGQSLQQEYNQLSTQYQLPQMNTELLNYQNIMNGSQDDISSELRAAGGTATQSQVLAMTSARNTVIMKQYTALSNQYTAAQQNVQNMMQYASTDQTNALARESQTASVTESMDSIYQNMVQMGMTMQQNNATNYRAILTAGGPDSLAESVAGDPTQQAIAESSLGLAPGTLTNPQQIDAWQSDTYKTQQLQLNSYRAAVYGYNAGYAPPGGVTNNYYGGNTPPSDGTGAPGTTPDPTAASGTSYSQDQLVRPSWLSPNIPIYGSSDDLKSAADAGKATQDPGTNNYVVPGVGYYQQQSDGSYALKSAIPPDPTQQQQDYSTLKQQIASAQATPQSMSPTVMRKYSLTANAALSNFENTGTYKVVSNVEPYLSAINAAAANPGDKSVSDFELLDSFVKAAKGGTGQVTDSQVNVMLQGASLGDNYATLQQKLNTGGVLSPAQRQSLISLAKGTYDDNLNDYNKLWTAAVENMKGQGIPAQFWSNLPDFGSLFQSQ